MRKKVWPRIVAAMLFYWFNKPHVLRGEVIAYSFAKN